MKNKKVYVCSECGSDHSKWQGQCVDCNAWNSLKEMVVESSKSTRHHAGFAGERSQITLLDKVELTDVDRKKTGISEFDRVLGGGFVLGSVILIGGEPGAGKSTLLLQTLCQLSCERSALYVTGEESLQQVAMRAKRLKLATGKLKMLAETNVSRIVEQIQREKPEIVVIDSIQVMVSDDLPSIPGSVAQVREAASVFTRLAKQTGAIIVLVGHVTKDGSLAGPKVLEHMIDCSILLESSGHDRFRTLRSYKNRFGAINEIGVFAMMEEGLKEVKNPSAIFLSRATKESSGSVVMVTWEGSRPMLIEVQALVDSSPFGNPRRVVVGMDQNRISMLLAVLHKHAGLQVGDHDVFVNAVGGVKIQETSADLAIIFSIVSSFKEVILPKDLVVFGEVGLSGELRPVPNGVDRIRESAKHGFKRAIIPKANNAQMDIQGMEIIAVDNISDALNYLF